MANTPLKELLKLPLLIEHYTKHKAENKSIGFIDFLKMHYFNGDPKDADYDEDMKLPFKTISNDFATIVFSTPNTVSIDVPKQIFIQTSQPKFGHQTLNFSSANLNSIWQPPRFC